MEDSTTEKPELAPVAAAPPAREIIVVGASAGGVAALLTLCSGLPAGLPAAVLAVVHIGSNKSVLPALLTMRGGNRALHAEDDMSIEHGTVYLAPPDRHMIIEGGRIRLTRTAKEHHTRPAIDPLFRTAAIEFGPRVIGVVLTGRLDDGTAGLQAVKHCGGLAVVQEPGDAEHPSMPLSALQSVAVDRVVPLDTMAQTLVRLLAESAPENAVDEGARARLEREQLVSVKGAAAIENLNAVGTPSAFSCPDCDGVLWEIGDTVPARYRCHTGHAFSLRSLDDVQANDTEDALWAAIRALEVREALLRRLAAQNRASGRDGDADKEEAEADAAATHAESLLRMLRQP